MKEPRDYIKEMKVDVINLHHIASTSVINGSLLMSIESAMLEYAKQKVSEQREIMTKHLNMRNVPNPKFKNGPDGIWES